VIRDAFKRLVPKGMRRRMLRMRRRSLRKSQQRKASPPVGAVCLGSLRRTKPISGVFGVDRGQPIDRYYIEDFMGRHGGAAGVIRGHVLEVEEAIYTPRLGDPAGVEHVDVLDLDPLNPFATVIADLTDAPDLPSNTFDCIICTQTLLLIYDVRAAVHTLHRILKPGGTALVTMPGISQICRPHTGRSWSDYWRFTTQSARQLFEEAFPPANVTLEVYGSVLSAAAFLYGLAAEELTRAELDVHDPDYQLLIGVKAVKR
jgi:SAM-dependent methyltransferase